MADVERERVTALWREAAAAVDRPMAREITFNAQRDPMFQDEHGNGWVPYARFCEVDDECGRLREQLDAARQALERIADLISPHVCGTSGAEKCHRCIARAALGVEGEADDE